MQPEQQLSGVYVILCTPFDERGNLDEASLQREVQFCVAAGVQGVVVSANASEVWTLTDEERRHITRLVLAELNGKLPTVVGVTAGSAQAAEKFARDAAAAGASAIMAAPPAGRPLPPTALYDYYRALAHAVTIPIVVQNCDPPGGVRLSAAFIARLVNELEHVAYIKEEVDPPGPAITADLASCGPNLKGVMGGLIGRFVLDEHRRGACGTMPASEVADVHVQIWAALAAGDDDTARAIFARLLPLLNYSTSYRVAIYKEVLYRRGIFRTNYLRSAGSNPLDPPTQRELDRILADLSPLFRVGQLAPRHEYAPAQQGVQPR
jgi:dihydrodipicolinate synthase/N-acetylneuraminate lyase